ncbi:NAD(P)H-dependent oxidoreductase [Corynebacterium sp. 320]|uniref:NAD(P)H-dependent oxidoreductase n=1 Tax=Corynebacterium TaxID=1716 RepID=UPI00125CB73A|nr:MULTISPECIES: NAD(P)H-dependent oxidoreductase [Corynebacterium]KAB1502720.1 NAD(P)H-dependent oxidoreductase [Corynebacterium sp. 320]KAB1550542.1 NAD(P)H-dependent oxidoreductase [Corynebacterium sp. 319]KAB1554731.1 NAD(P)H-dependent oxidoreductase [Corynebacterium sp. 321]KAB3526383.1 NAD(P)H-dependent oxidoreductase [Corynebacterium sp. 250]KAB3537772.1 NAD(P)H-dependent oxidoreductase [Corynebacterium sp. 366]
MTSTRTILVIHHSPTPTARDVADTVLTAVRDAAETINTSSDFDVHVDVVERTPLEGMPEKELAEELVAADAVIFGTTANFGYISGALKHYFDVVFVQAHERTEGKPASWWIRGGYDTTGAAKAMRTLTTGFSVDVAAEPVEFCGEVDPHREALTEMAQTIVGAALG